MGREFVGGTRNGTECAEDLVPGEALQQPGNGAKVKIPDSQSSEIYILGEDDRLHYQFTVTPKKWERSGDPCPICASNQTQLIQFVAAPDRIIPTLGGPLYRLNGRRYAIVQCNRCGEVSSVLLDE